MAAIEVEGLRRTYRTTTGSFRRRSKSIEAVRGIDFAVGEGELFGLLGPNGAGKTTTIKMLITLLIPTGGKARVLGLDVVEDAKEVRRRIGYVFGGERGVYERLSGYDNLRYFAELYGVPPREQRARIGELLELVGLAGREHERAEGYSRGMKQRLHVARGLLHDPEVIFLDEPTIGLDPVGAREVRATIGSLTEAGKTVLLTTHYMFEADALCDRIAVISHGEIVAHGTPTDTQARRRRGSGRRGRGLRPRRGSRRPRARARRRELGRRRGARAGAGAGRADGARRRADARDPRLPGRGRRRPHLPARAHARGRVRRAGSE